MLQKNNARSRGRKLKPSAEEKLRFASELVPQLARAIGPLCEVALHENTSTPPTIRAIGNNHISGRSRGDLMTRIDIDGKDVTHGDKPLFNYVSILPDGRKIRVSLIPLTDEGEVIGYIAVNFLIHDLEVAMQALSVLATPEPRHEAIKEKFLSPKQVIVEAAKEYVRMVGRPIALLDKRERIEFLKQLKDRGVFRMRGAIGSVAALLGVSRTAIYDYLSKLDDPA